MADPRRYNAVAMSLHWLIALLIFANIGLAWWFGTLHGLAKDGPVQIHKSIGVTVLVLSVLRLAWRIVVPPPPLPPSVRGLERLAAHTVHVLLYVVMIGMPLTGWAMSSASPLIRIHPISWFGVFDWPSIGPLATLPPPRMHAAHETFEAAHKLGAKLAYALIVLHVLAALRHQFLEGDEVVWRMLPVVGRRA